jgi:putative membrane protein
MSVSDMPALNATLNAISAVLLTLGFIFIKGGNKIAHRNCMVGAFGTSSVFLVSYVTHKILVRGVHTKLGAEGVLQILYYTMLISHVLLAMAIVPLVLMTIARARRGDFEAHKRIARWTWPIWMYVSVTGVLIYFFLYQWWPAA